MSERHTGWRLECYEELTSTSDVCLERARGGEAPGLALLALRQTKGRGSRGRNWANAGQSLAFSALLDAGQAAPETLGGWPFVASLAFFEGLATSVPAARDRLMIKWPNDILLDGQKLGGILIEREGSMLVIGMGANLGQPPQEEQIGRVAASLGQCGPVPPPADVARAILAQLTYWCSVWQQGGFAVLCVEWRKRAHPVGTPLVVSGGTTYEKGQFAGLAADGRLLLETEEGMKTIATGDILLAEQGLTLLLVIDAGNTNVVFAVHDGEKWRGVWRITMQAQRTSDEYAVWLLALLKMQGIAPDDIEGAVIGTVVPAALYHLRTLCRQWFAVEPLLASARLDWGFSIKMDNPDEVGVDRLLNGLASHHLYGGPLVVIDFGTATTFDVVDAEGSYCGGVIAPGINLSVEALHQAAARLPRIGIGRPAVDSVIGRNTVTAMRSGVFWGYVGLIEGIVERIRQEVGQTMKVLATGGLAPLFSEGTTVFDHVDSMLTLNGLRILAGRNPLPRLTIEKDFLTEG